VPTWVYNICLNSRGKGTTNKKHGKDELSKLKRLKKKGLTFFQTFYLSHFLFVLRNLKSYECVSWSFRKVL
jgi:hypothetical protein